MSNTKGTKRTPKAEPQEIVITGGFGNAGNPPLPETPQTEPEGAKDQEEA